jgi:hypothetical protein
MTDVENQFQIFAAADLTTVQRSRTNVVINHSRDIPFLLAPALPRSSAANAALPLNNYLGEIKLLQVCLRDAIQAI